MGYNSKAVIATLTAAVLACIRNVGPVLVSRKW